MPSLRSNAPSSPGFLQWSAALRIRRFSALENCRRLAVAATSGSGAVEAADAAAAVALRAPCAAASAGTPATPCGKDPFNKLLMRYLPLLSKFAKGGVSHHIGTGGRRRPNSRRADPKSLRVLSTTRLELFALIWVPMFTRR